MERPPASDAVEVDELDIEERGRRQLVANVDRDIATLGGLLPELLSQGERAERAELAAIGVLDKYLPQPQLLDKHLVMLLAPLIDCLMSEVRAAAKEKQDSSASPIACNVFAWRIVAALCRIRTGKALIRRFPNDPPLLVQLLRFLHRRYALLGWEARYITLMWLSLVLAAPYALSEMLANEKPGIEELMRLAEQGVSEGGRVADAAARVLARLATRADGAPRLAALLSYATAALPPPPLEPLDGALGALRGSLLAFKHGDRAILSPSAPQAIQIALGLRSNGAETRKATLRLLLYSTLSLLPPRVATWKYHKSVNVLFGAQATTAPTAPQSSPAAPLAVDDKISLSPEIGQVTGHLLAGLQERDTVVRWTAAKGIARLALRLPQGAAEQLIDAVLKYFPSAEPAPSVHALHGTLLATAELARRGLLLPARLPLAVEGATRGLSFEELKGSQPLGADVRDAAAFVCWSLTRAYDTAAMAAHAPTLVEALLRTALFDRGLSVRRADKTSASWLTSFDVAAAALQEACGRLAEVIPHSVTLSVTVDFNGVGPRQDAYLLLAPRVAALDAYRTPLLAEAYARTRHWDASIRLLAAEALEPTQLPARLAPLAPSIAAGYLPASIVGAQEADLPRRHGSLVAAAALLRALHGCSKVNELLSEETLSNLVHVVPLLEKNRLYRGKGGETVRKAAAELIAAIATANLSLTPLPAALVGRGRPKPTRDVLLESIEEHLRQPSADLTATAVATLAIYSRTYLLSDTAAALLKLLTRYCSALREVNPAVRRAYALALGAMPGQLLAVASGQVLQALVIATQPETDVELRDAESRKNAVHAIGQVIRTLGNAAAASNDGRDAVLAVLVALDDHTTDERGDVGSWVREAALEELTEMCGMWNTTPHAWLREVCVNLTCAAIRAALERLDKIRTAAVKCLESEVILQLSLASQPALQQHLPDLAMLRAALTVNVNWSASLVVFQRLTPLLLSPTYALDADLLNKPHVAEGLACSLGGLGRGHAADAGAALESTLRIASSDQRTAAADVFLSSLAKQTNSTRLALPLLRSVLFMVTIPSLATHVTFRSKLLDALRAQVKGCTDIPKLLLVIECATALSNGKDETATGAKGALLFFLTHAYPKLRIAAAEALMGRLHDGDDNMARDILCTGAWAKGPVAELQHLKQRLYDLMRVPRPTPPLATAAKT